MGWSCGARWRWEQFGASCSDGWRCWIDRLDRLVGGLGSGGVSRRCGRFRVSGHVDSYPAVGTLKTGFGVTRSGSYRRSRRADMCSPGPRWRARSVRRSVFGRVCARLGRARCVDRWSVRCARCGTSLIGTSGTVNDRSLFQGPGERFGPGATALDGPGPRRRAPPHHQPRAAPPTTVGQQGRRDASAAM